MCLLGEIKLPQSTIKYLLDPKLFQQTIKMSYEKLSEDVYLECSIYITINQKTVFADKSITSSAIDTLLNL